MKLTETLDVKMTDTGLVLQDNPENQFDLNLLYQNEGVYGDDESNIWDGRATENYDWEQRDIKYAFTMWTLFTISKMLW